jgi:hypothetical protein
VCSECGAKTEYPDTWEKNFVLPRQKTSAATAKKATPSPA